jgi:signal transduction histidine kinase
VKLNRKFTIAALVLGVLLFIGGWRAFDLRQSRQDMLVAADARARNLAHILAEYLAGSFAGGDAALRQLALHGARIGGLRAPTDEWLPILTQARAGLSGIGAISVIDGTSTVRHSTRPEIVGQRRAEWTMQQALSADPGDTLIVGPPVVAVVPPFEYLIPLARRLFSRDGRVEGAVVASFIPDALRAFFRTVDVGQQGSVWVFHPSGITLLREPSAYTALGQNAAGNELYEAAIQSPRGTLRGLTTPERGVQRSAFERVATVPLTVAVSLDESEVLAPWRRELALSIVAMLSVVFVCGVTMLGLFRQMDAVEVALAREKAARAEAEAASALKDEFLMTASHELRTPLGVMLTGATVLASNRINEAERRQTIDAIARNARTQARLVGDLLDVSKGMAGSFRLDVSTVAVADIVRAAVETVKVAAEAKGVRLDVQIDPAVGTLVGDGSRLQQVLWNLLSNAVKFTAGGGEARVRAGRHGANVIIVVSDTGIGISPEFLPHVFDRFRQEHTGMTRPFGGLGLGLAIARHLVELHGGELTVESEGRGRGARFTVRLPVGGIRQGMAANRSAEPALN